MSFINFVLQLGDGPLLANDHVSGSSDFDLRAGRLIGNQMPLFVKFSWALI